MRVSFEKKRRRKAAAIRAKRKARVYATIWSGTTLKANTSNGAFEAGCKSGSKLPQSKGD
jgi:hypothetical protein